MHKEQLQFGAGVVMGEHLQTTVKNLTVLPVVRCLASNRRTKLENFTTSKESGNSSVQQHQNCHWLGRV